MIYVKDLLKLESFHKFNLICGQNGLNRQVSWPNIAQTPSIKEWLVGGDVILMTGIGLNITENLLSSIIRQASDGRAACLIILINKKHIPMIPEGTKECADSLEIPIFAAPWKTKLSNLIRDISEIVFNDQHNEQLMNEFLEELLVGKADLNSDENKSRLEKYRLYDSQMVAVMSFSGNSCKKAGTDGLFQNSRICGAAHIMLEKQFGICHYLIKSQKIVFIFTAGSSDSTVVLEQFRIIKESLEKKFSGVEFHIGVGGRCCCPKEIETSYRQAQKALAFSEKEGIVCFEKMGICQLLFEIKDQSIINSYVEKNIGALTSYDHIHNQNLLRTLKVYLSENGNLIHTAEKLYIHRNTLLRRVEKIEGILGTDLKNAEVRNTLYNCIMISSYLQG